jgi:hypothetical protein
LTIFVVDFDELHFGELFEIFSQWTRDVVERTIRLAAAHQIYMGNAIRKGKFTVTRETVEDQCQTPIPFDIAGSFEEFIEHRAQQILAGGDETRRSHLIRKLPTDQTFVICEVDIDFHIQRRACGR